MTTKDIEIKDQDGNALVLCGHRVEPDGYASVLAVGPGAAGGFRLAADGAGEVVRWLTETFQLTQELEALTEVGNMLRIVVPPATGEGAPREVTWSGDGEPPAWFRELSATALTGVTPAQVRHAATAWEAAATALTGGQRNGDGKYLEIVTALLEIMRGAGAKSRTKTLVADIQTILGERWAVRQVVRGEDLSPGDLVARVEELYRATARPGAAPSELAILRKLMGVLGVDRIDLLPERVEALRRECDAITLELCSWAGMPVDPNGVDQLKVIRNIKAQYEARHRQVSDRHHRSRAEYDRSVQGRIDNAAAKEREARADVQQRLDVAHAVLRIVLRSSAPGSADVLDTINKALDGEPVSFLEQQLEDSAEALRSANVQLGDLRARLTDRQEMLDRAREERDALRSALDESTRQVQVVASQHDALTGKLDAVREGISSALSRLDSVSGDDAARARAGLRDVLQQSDPNQA